MPTAQYNKHVSFRLSGGGAGIQLTMPINPDQIQTTSPVRQTTTQTMGGIFKDIYGIGIRSITLQGSTGWRTSPLTGLDGQQTAQKLWSMYVEYYSRIKITPSVELLLVNDIDSYSLKITMDDFQVFRNKAEPLITRYSIPITILHDLNDPPPPIVDVPVKIAQSVPTNVQSSSASVANTKPAPIPYTVKSGDTLWAISNMFYHDGTQYQIIAQYNNISSPYIIYPNQIIMVPYR